MSIVLTSIILSKIRLLIVNIYFFYQIFSWLKPKQYEKCQHSWLFKKIIWKLKKNKVSIYNQQLNFWLNNWCSRKLQLITKKKNQNVSWSNWPNRQRIFDVSILTQGIGPLVSILWLCSPLVSSLLLCSFFFQRRA